ncbi:50S ribosomal protein L24 [Candidatus Parcubacteria bacterium]|nr:MAG: 50S ribosomal protein L24 [Candidatus Parcubacteria bacterium]
MKIKINDKVKVTAGKDKGKTGKVIQVMPQDDKVVVEGVNVMYKHIKSRKSGEKGQRVQFNGPINSSNVVVICPKCSKESRLGIRVTKSPADPKKVQRARFCKKCNEVID